MARGDVEKDGWFWYEKLLPEERKKIKLTLEDYPPVGTEMEYIHKEDDGSTRIRWCKVYGDVERVVWHQAKDGNYYEVVLPDGKSEVLDTKYGRVWVRGKIFSLTKGVK